MLFEQLFLGQQNYIKKCWY